MYFFTHDGSAIPTHGNEVQHHHRHVQRILQKRWMAVTPTASAR